MFCMFEPFSELSNVQISDRRLLLWAVSGYISNRPKGLFICRWTLLLLYLSSWMILLFRLINISMYDFALIWNWNYALLFYSLLNFQCHLYYYPLFRVRIWNNGVRCMVFFAFFLWISWNKFVCSSTITHSSNLWLIKVWYQNRCPSVEWCIKKLITQHNLRNI